MKRLFAILFVAVGGLPEPSSADPSAFFEQYCLRCHDEKKQKGKFRIDTLSRDFGDELVAQDWDELMFRINSGEMPPEEEEQPSADEVGEVAEWIAARLAEGRAERMSQRNPVNLYRLSREEYAHTVRDLLGVHFDVDAPGAFNEDPRWHGFDRIGSLLSLSPSHVDRYFEAASAIVAKAFPGKRSKPQSGRVEAVDDRMAKRWLEENGLKETPRWLLLPGQPRGAVRTREDGLYRIRIQLSALPSFRGRIPHLTIWDDKTKRSLFGKDVRAPEEKPVVIEMETFLPAGSIQLLNEAPGTFEGRTLSHTREVPFFRTDDRRFNHPASHKLYRADGQPIFPMIIVDWFEWEGPIETEDAVARREGLFPAGDSPDEVASCLDRFLERAWRRPATGEERGLLLDVIAKEREAGESWDSAYRAALVAAMTSKNFFYHIEGSPGENRSRLNDWELASRLSYFLWSSMPDDALFAAARAGALHEPATLRSQLERMLDDPRIDRFLDSFPRQWLQLHRVGSFPPDPELYPDYDLWLERSMVLEATEVFGEVFRKNLSIREFLSSDWTMLNARLIRHYDLPVAASTEFRRVRLRPEDHRGGLLSQAGVLSLTSDGTRHRPVHRGVWVSEAIFGKTPPPPPPNVEPLSPTPAESPKATIRQQLEAHATHSTCASCHRKIDPLGFAFDNYDAIGRWRTHETTDAGRGEDPPVDASGSLPGLGKFSGPAEFKALLLGEEDRFAEAFAGQLATYALRRVMTIDDRAQLEAIAEESRKGGYGLRTLIENFVLSEMFQSR